MNIRFETKKQVVLDTYRTVLEDGVSTIVKRLGENFDYVKWVIYDADELFSTRQKMYGIPMNPRNGKEYGFCKLEKNEIWISTHTIQLCTPFIMKHLNISGPSGFLDRFTDVIIDELAHIKSRADHNTVEYDRVYHRFYAACCGSSLL